MFEPLFPEAGAADVRAAADELAERLPEPLRPLAEVAHNYRWAWDPDGEAVFADVDTQRWQAVRHDPARFLVEAGPAALRAAAENRELTERVRALTERVGADLARPSADVGTDGPLAFVCAEYGVHPSLPLYSGGLGILAGDILKEASDLALPMVAVGLLYRFGYFHQRLEASGWQQEYWTEHDPVMAPTVPVTGPDGRPLEITVPIYDTEVVARVWRVDVGRVPLFLLDTNLPANRPLDRWITARLYEGIPELRLAQYVLLGVGAVRALDALGIRPGLLHLNEGHPACAALEMVAGRIADGVGRHEAIEEVRGRCVFTTHTPVAAGNETYPSGRFLAALADLPRRAGLDEDGLLDLARTRPGALDEEPGMTPLALRLAGRTNGVSARHGEVARGMWQGLFGGDVQDVPIAHVTNGVHLPTWLAAPMGAVLDRHLGDGWRERADDPATWAAVDEIPAAELWQARCASRRTLIDWASERSVEDRLRRGLRPDVAEAVADVLDPDLLTFGFARRVAQYKRLYLLGFDPERIARILEGRHPTQVLVAGKAHPRDNPGKGIVRDLFGLGAMPQVARRVSYLEDYDMEVGALLTAGCDVWVNVPRPPLEASGTSGMKVVFNGGLNVSVLDGWWAEAYDGTNGWAIDGAIDDDHGRQDHLHATALFDLLEHEVIPLFNDRDADGIPQGWVDRMRASMRTCGWRFTATRMLHDYLDGPYRA